MSDQSFLLWNFFLSKKAIPIKIVEQQSEHLEELNDDFIVEESISQKLHYEGFQFL
jgi:hypothetical protein